MQNPVSMEVAQGREAEGQQRLTGLESFDGDRRGVVPESLPHLAELSVAKLAHKLEWRAVDLPLVTSVVGQTRRDWLLNLCRP